MVDNLEKNLANMSKTEFKEMRDEAIQNIRQNTIGKLQESLNAETGEKAFDSIVNGVSSAAKIGMDTKDVVFGYAMGIIDPVVSNAKAVKERIENIKEHVNGIIESAEKEASGQTGGSFSLTTEGLLHDIYKEYTKLLSKTT